MELLQRMGAFTPEEALTPLGARPDGHRQRRVPPPLSHAWSPPYTRGLRAGHQLASLPVNPRIGKAMLVAASLGCLDPVLTIAACLAHRNPFVIPMGKEREADEAKRRFAEGEASDHRALLRAFEGAWHTACGATAAAAGPFADPYAVPRAAGWVSIPPSSARGQYCWRNFLSEPGLRMIEGMKRQFLDTLMRFTRSMHVAATRTDAAAGAATHLPSSLRPQATDMESLLGWMNRNARRWPVVKTALAAGLYPNLCRVTPRGRRAACLTLRHPKVQPHMGSVNAKRSDFEHRWLVFFEMVRPASIGPPGVPAHTLLPCIRLCASVAGAHRWRNQHVRLHGSQSARPPPVRPRRRDHGLAAALRRAPSPPRLGG